MILRLHTSDSGIPLTPLRSAKGEIPRSARNDTENARNDSSSLSDLGHLALHLG